MACRCNECKKLVHARNLTMVMIHDELWRSIAPIDEEFILCDECIEKRLERKITSEDLKYVNKSSMFEGRILVNMLYAEKHNLNYPSL